MGEFSSFFFQLGFQRCKGFGIPNEKKAAPPPKKQSENPRAVQRSGIPNGKKPPKNQSENPSGEAKTMPGPQDLDHKSGAEGMQIVKNSKMLKNARTLAIVAVHTNENELLKV